MITTLFREPFPTNIQIIYLSRYSPLAGLPHQNPSTCLRYSDFDVGALSSNTPYSGGGLPTYIGLRVNLYRARREAILVVASTYIGRSSDLYRFAPSHSPTHLSEETHKSFALSRVFLLSSGGKSILLMKKKAPSRSSFPLSMYVVLKTRHVNPNIHVHRY